MKSRLPLLLATVGILLRIIPVWAPPTWYDENFSILLGRLPIGRMFYATAGDVHPPLWYLICWPLAHIPNIPAWAIVRLPSVLAGIATLWVWWQILQIMVPSPRVRLVAFGLFCLLPQQIYYSQEGRMYALLTLLVLLAWLCILHHRWYWLVVVAAAMLYLQNYGLLYAAALWFAAMIYNRNSRYNWRVTISMLMAGILYIPWLIVLLRQMGHISGSYWILYFSLPRVLADLAHTFFATSTLKADMVNIAVFYGVLTWVLIWSLRRRTLNLPAAILAFLPLVLAALVSLIWQPIMLHRALIPSSAFIALLLAEPVEHLKLRSLLMLAVFFVPALLVNILGTAIRAHWADNTLIREQAVLSMIDSRWQKGDLLFYADDGIYVTGEVYWKNVDNAMRMTTYGMTYGALSPQTRSAIGERTGNLSGPVTGRTWVISAETPLNPTCEHDYMQGHGLLKTRPVACSEYDSLVKSCVYLVEP
jgi:uncharacterized membrane protein